MINEIVLNVNKREKRLAILENNNLVELYTEKEQEEVVSGNIYNGIIRDVLPGMGAAFIDIGLKRTAFLHYNYLNLKFMQTKRKVRLNNNSSNIGKVLKPGQELPVQVLKGPIGKKGAKVSGTLTIPGKFLVYLPYQSKIAISRKITDKNEKKRIKAIVKKIKKHDVGLIIRTDAEGYTEEEFKQEYDGLAQTWKLIEKQIKHEKAPACLFDENDLTYTLIRDLFSAKIDRLIVDNKNFINIISQKLKKVNPQLINKIEYYKENSPIFDAYGIEKKIDNIFRSQVKLPSGGFLKIEQTEALVAIDVNTGSYVGKSHYEETITNTNIEAATIVAQQIRLRNLSGIMIIDFIDMKKSKNQDKVLQTLKRALKRDRAKNRVYPFTELGLVQISRKRMRKSVVLSQSKSCPVCNGTGRILSVKSLAFKITRWLDRAKYFLKNQKLKIIVNDNVKKYLRLHPEIYSNFKDQITIEANSDFKADDFKIINLENNKDITEKYS